MSHFYPSEEPIMTLWHTAQAARAKRDFNLMKSVIERMVVRRKPGFWMFIAFDVRLDVSEVLLLAGKECNACMACDLAIDCFSCAIEIMGNVSCCERSSKVMSEAIECLVNTHLQNDDLDGAQVLLDDWNRMQYTCMDEPILIEDLRNELRLRQLIRIPSTIFALYLKTLAQVKMGNASMAQDTVDVLQREVYKCRFADYYCCAVFGQDSMRRLAKSLLRFALRAADKGNH